MASGFGFLEVGAATPVAQPGNPAPRLFRLPEDKAAINRFGFNNDGANAIAQRLAQRPAGIPVGLNLGANKTSADKAADFAKVLTACGPHVDFATVNVSSPNTERLRDLQGAEALSALLQGLPRGWLDVSACILKMLDHGCRNPPDRRRGPCRAGRRPDRHKHDACAHGAEVAPPRAKVVSLANHCLIAQPASCQAQRRTEGSDPVDRGRRRVKRGASLGQNPSRGQRRATLHGPCLWRTVAGRDPRAPLDDRLKAQGFASVKDAVGTDRDAWLWLFRHACRVINSCENRRRCEIVRPTMGQDPWRVAVDRLG